jgi:hypothetical protein
MNPTAKYALIVGAVALTGAMFAHAEPPSFVQNGTAGFVVADMKYALGKDADESGACPDGMTEGMVRNGAVVGYGATNTGAAGSATPAATQPAAQPSSGEASGATRPAGAPTDEAERQFLRTIMDTSRPSPCMNPEKFEPDPKFRTVKVENAKAYGIDIDGRDSRQKGKPTPGTCAHSDLLGMDGEHGIDNQFYRLVGCNKAYQSTGPGNTWAIEMLTGAWGVLITLSGVDDIANDDSVDVLFVANGDPIELSPTREPLRDATYAMDQDPRFRAKTHGRIKNGVLTTDPVDVRFHKITNSIYLERTLQEARAQMTLSADGTLEGYLAGYTPIEDLYNFEYAFRNGKNGKGGPADSRLIMISAMGRSATLTYTCNGAYYALRELADGNPDPQSGRCTSISTQYRIKAIPAFVVDSKTESKNEDLERR